MTKLKKISLFSFAFVLGLIAFVGFNAKAEESAALDCGENSAVEVTVNWNGPEDPNYVVEVCPGEVMSNVPETPAYPGYTFDKFTSGDADIDLATNTEWGTEPTFEVVAQWIGNSVNLKFTYPVESVPADEVPATVGEDFDLNAYNQNAIDKAPEGQVFTGWAYELNDESVIVNAPSFLVPAMDADAELVLTAQYANQIEVNIILPEGVEWAEDFEWNSSYAQGAVINLPLAEDVEIANANQELAGWQLVANTRDDEGAGVLDPGAEYTVGDADVTFTAVLKNVEGLIVVKPIAPYLKEVGCDKAAELIQPEQPEGIIYYGGSGGSDGKTFVHNISVMAEEGYILDNGEKTMSWNFTGEIKPCITPTTPNTGDQSLFFALMAGVVGSLGLGTGMIIRNRRS